MPLSFIKISFISLLLLPICAKSQCIQIIDQPVETIQPFVNLIENYMQLSLERYEDTTNKNTIAYKHPKGYCSFTAKLKKQERIEGDSIIPSYIISSARIYGPAERIDSLFLFLKKQGKKCTYYEVQEQSVVHNNQWFRHYNYHPDKEEFIAPIKEIIVEKIHF